MRISIEGPERLCEELLELIIDNWYNNYINILWYKILIFIMSFPQMFGGGSWSVWGEASSLSPPLDETQPMLFSPYLCQHNVDISTSPHKKLK